jgi:hypothetical protein
VSTFRVLLFRHDAKSPFQYELTNLDVIETSGKSSATLRSLAVDAPGGERDGDCTQDQMVRGRIIAAGASRDLAATMGYCAPYVDTRAEVSEVTFIATFADDQGRIGEVTGSANVADCTLGGTVGLINCK